MGKSGRAGTGADGRYRGARLTRVLAALAISALVLAGLASASPRGKATKIVVKLEPSLVVPRPTDVLPGARGTFTGWFESQGDRVRFRYRVSFSELTGPATAIHIHLGKRGTSGRVLIPLCHGGRCSGVQETFANLSKTLVDSMQTGAYIDVHTAKNPRGELRGQIVGVAVE
jgi:hypothetical protein